MINNIIILTLLTSLFCLLISTSASAAPKTAIERFQSYEDAVVTVKGRIINVSPTEDKAIALDPVTGQLVTYTNRKAQILENTGAGVVLDSQGVVVTNTHIIYGSNQVLVVLQNGKEFQASVLYVSPEYDFSLLKIDSEEPLKAINWADSNQISLGEEIITIGHSPLLDKTLSGGQVAAIGVRSDDSTQTPEFIQINVNHYPGDSGGPVFDHDGHFLGLMNAKVVSANKVSLAIPANKIHAAYSTLTSP